MISCSCQAFSVCILYAEVHSKSIVPAPFFHFSPAALLLVLIQPFRYNIPAQVAVTGVKGLKTIVPCAGIASWAFQAPSSAPRFPRRMTEDYTFYMMPTVYTLAEGHRLELSLLTWDPYRAFLNENESPEPAEGPKLADYNYSFDIDLDSLKVQLPVVP